MAISGSGGVGGSGGGVSGTGGIGTGGADARGGIDASTGSGGIAAAGAGGTPTGGNGTGGLGSGGGGGISDGGAPETATGGNHDAGLGGTGGGKDASIGGTGGVSMTGGVAGGSGGTIGSGGSSGSSCPEAAPVNGAVCNQPAWCAYEDCAAGGRTVASCSGTSWQVTTGACTTFTCRAVNGAQVTCPAGQICLATYPKDPVCVSHTCGTGPLTTECVPGADPGTAGFCSVSGTAAEGITMFCCPTGGTSC